MAEEAAVIIPVGVRRGKSRVRESIAPKFIRGSVRVCEEGTK